MSKSVTSLSLIKAEIGEDDEDDEADAVHKKPVVVKLTTETEWSRAGTRFYARTRADKAPHLPSGIYRFVQPQDQPWFLDRTGAAFEFPFKVYNASQKIIDRICDYWSRNGGNLGVLLNGLRGAGKTMTTQLLANRLIEELDAPVLVVRSPIPLQEIFDTVQQDFIVIFDEFEKTHDERHFPGCQQALLSTIDGMSRSIYNKLILFTTNTKNINENFVDRPSRIHYKFEFNRCAKEVIDGLINDCIPEHLAHFKSDIYQYLDTRSICTIDIVKAVIADVVTFEESPIEFAHILNVAEGEPPQFTVSIVDPETNAVRSEVTQFFKLDRRCTRYTGLLCGSESAIENYDNGEYGAVKVQSSGWNGSITVLIMDRCEEEPGYWLVQLQVPTRKMFWGDYMHLFDTTLWLDKKPDDWAMLPTPERVRKEDEARSEVNDRYEMATDKGSCYGTGDRAIFKVLIEPNHAKSQAPPQYQASTGTGGLK